MFKNTIKNFRKRFNWCCSFIK